MRFFEANPYNLAAACLCVFADWWRVSLWLICFSEFVFQVGVSLEDHHRTLPFQVSHELRDAIFGRYTYQKVHMIWHHVSLYDFHSFPFTQILDYVSYIRSELVVYYFPAVFGRKHDMILAHPFRMC